MIKNIIHLEGLKLEATTVLSFPSFPSSRRITPQCSDRGIRQCPACLGGGFHGLNVRTHAALTSIGGCCWLRRLMVLHQERTFQSSDDIGLSLMGKAKTPPTPYQCGHREGTCKHAKDVAASHQANLGSTLRRLRGGRPWRTGPPPDLLHKA